MKRLKAVQNLQEPPKNKLTSSSIHDSFDLDIRSMAYNKEGRYFSFLVAKKEIQIWNNENGKFKQVMTLSKPSGDVQYVLWDPGYRNSLYSGNSDHTVCFWDINKRFSLTHTIETQQDNCYLTESPDHNYLLSVSSGSLLTLIDISHHTILDTFQYHDRIYQVQFSPNSNYLFVATRFSRESECIDILSISQNKITKAFSVPSHVDKCTLLDISPDGQSFVTASGEDCISFWDLNDLVCYSTIPSQIDIPWLKYNCTGEYLATSIRPHLLSIIDVKTKEEVFTHEVFSVIISFPLVLSPVVSLIPYSFLWNPERSKARMFAIVDKNKNEKCSLTVYTLS